jgi:hypothetical protein
MHPAARHKLAIGARGSALSVTEVDPEMMLVHGQKTADTAARVT